VIRLDNLSYIFIRPVIQRVFETGLTDAIHKRRIPHADREVNFDDPNEEEPITLSHFQLPFMAWLSGLGASSFLALIEVFKRRPHMLKSNHMAWMK